MREEHSCPVCMEHTKDEWFGFPCGHLICGDCNDKMIAHRFLSCPTCRTPREGVSQRQVDSANQSRAQIHSEEDSWQPVNAGGRSFQTLFFPDETGGAHPFHSLLTARREHPPLTGSVSMDESLAQVLQAEEMVGVGLPLTRMTSASASARVTVHGPMRGLLNRLLSPGTIAEFLAQREIARGQHAEGHGL